MALFPDRHPLLRQPSHVARINERHWLARDLIFVHSGYTAFAAGRPLVDVGTTLRSNALTGTQNPALVGAYGWVPDGSNYTVIPLGFNVPLPLTLSAWWHGTSSTSGDYIFGLSRSAGSGGTALLRSTGEVAQIGVLESPADGGSGPSTATAAGGYASGRWQHGVGVSRSDTYRTIYADGGNVAASPVVVTRTHPSDSNQIIIAGSLAATPVAATTAISAIALPLIVARELAPDEVARLHDEQRSNPWNLFTERRIWVPVSAAGGGAFKAAWAARPQRTIGSGVI